MKQLPQYVRDFKTAYEETYAGCDEALPPTLHVLLKYLTAYEPSDELDKSLSFWIEIIAACERIFPNILTREYPTEFWFALEQQLEHDNRRWGDTWRKREIAKQSLRCQHTFNDYLSQYENAIELDEVEILLKIAGNAFICALRLLTPDYKTI